MDKVVMVLGHVEAQGTRLVRPSCYRMSSFDSLLGVYRLDHPRDTGLAFAGMVEALLYIRDRGGECLAGEPLPEKPEEVWARFAMPEYLCANTPHYYRCGRCLDSWFGNPTRPRCPHCDAKLASSQPWIPVKAGGTPND